MYFLLSGEGPTDLGSTNSMTPINEGGSFDYGPMAMIVDRIVEKTFNYSILESHAVGFVSKQELERTGAALKTTKKPRNLPGKKRVKETNYYYKNARVLASIAKSQQEHLGVEVVAVLFRDSDGTASANRGLWETKWQSMLNGFEEEKFRGGVPMLPKPKSEAWLICALKDQPYQNCDALEEWSGNDDSPKNLKAELVDLFETRFGIFLSREILCQIFEKGLIDIDQIRMPKFLRFRRRLEDVILERE